MPNLTVDFYQVEVSGNDSFHQAMNTLQQLPNNEQRNLELQDTPIRLREISQTNQDWAGDLMKIRLNEAAVLASLDGSVEAITGVDETRGLGENTAFLYDHRLNVIAVQRNKGAVSASRMAYYFGSKGGLSNMVVFSPIFQLETYEKLRNMRAVKRFRIRIARPSNIEAMAENSPTLAAAAQLASDFQSPSVEVVLSVGRHRGALNKTPVLTTVRQLLTRHNDDPHLVQKIEVSGRDEDDHATTCLDLLKERLHVTVPMEVSPVPDTFYRRRQSVLSAAFTEKRTEIRAIVEQ